jgi:hypothetical protein
MILPQILINGGSVALNLTPTFISATQPSLPLSSYYNTYGLDQDQINSAINTWYDANNDKLIVTITGATDALSFGYKFAEQSASFSSGSDTITTNRTFTISGLTPGSTYKIQIRGYEFANGTGEYGNYMLRENIFISKFARLAKSTATSDLSVQDTSLTKTEEATYGITNNELNNLNLTNPEKESNRSLASLTNLNKDPNIYAVAYKPITHFPIPPSPITSTLYYSFGTTLLLDASTESPGESGGFGFFVNNFANTGYFIQVDSTKRSADIESKRRVKLFRMLNGDKVFVADSQVLPETTLDILMPGKPYKIDVKVKHTGTVAEIEIYVNGFKIFIEDNTPLPPTAEVAMFSSIGTIFFDYIYGYEINDKDYNDPQLYNNYSYEFSTNVLKLSLGNKIFNKNSQKTGTQKDLGSLEDFGKIAREIRKVDVTFSNAPAFPISPSTGINDFVHIIGHKTDNFKSEIYVMNNSGFFTPLSDGNVSLVIYGYNIYKSGSLEYKTEESNEFTKDEPIYFDSDWIQNEENAEELAVWLKNQWSKGYLMAEVKVFGGALISVGDIVTISYPYHSLTTAKKFLVQSVNHSYSDGGLDTTLTCRSLQS